MREISDEELDRLLAACHLFNGLNEAQLTVVKKKARLVKLKEGEPLFHHGQPAKRFFLLHSGCVKLFRVSREGMEKVIEIIQSRRTFAEAVMFMEVNVFPVNAEALAQSEVLSFDTQSYMEILHASPKACFNLLGSMSAWLHQHVEEIEKLTLQNATYRLVSYLLSRVPPDEVGASEVNLSVPKRVIASRLSVQPETLSRLLQRLSKQGLISVGEQTVHIKDVDQLREFVEMDE